MVTVTCETIKDGISFTQEELQRERWLPVVSYGGAYIGLYQVSNLGRVRSLDRYVNVVRKDGARQVRTYKGQLLAPRATKDGYYQVLLCAGGVRKTAYTHRLVAEAFLKNPENKQQVNHIDGNKKNNSVKNLEWSTPAENNQHAVDTGLNRNKGESHPSAKLSASQALEIYLLAHRGEFTCWEIADILSEDYGFKVSKKTVSNIKNGYLWAHVTGHENRRKTK